MSVRQLLAVILGVVACGGDVAGVRQGPPIPTTEVELFNDGRSDLMCEAGGLTVVIPAGHTADGRAHSLVAPFDAGDDVRCAWAGGGSFRVVGSP